MVYYGLHGKAAATAAKKYAAGSKLFKGARAVFAVISVLCNGRNQEAKQTTSEILKKSLFSKKKCLTIKAQQYIIFGVTIWSE